MIPRSMTLLPWLHEWHTWDIPPVAPILSSVGVAMVRGSSSISMPGMGVSTSGSSSLSSNHWMELPTDILDRGRNVIDQNPQTLRKYSGINAPSGNTIKVGVSVTVDSEIQKLFIKMQKLVLWNGKKRNLPWKKRKTDGPRQGQPTNVIKNLLLHTHYKAWDEDIA